MFGNFKIADLVAYHFMKIDYRCREDLQRGRIVSERDYVSTFATRVRDSLTPHFQCHSQTVRPQTETENGVDGIIVFKLDNLIKIGLFEAKRPQFTHSNLRWDVLSSRNVSHFTEQIENQRKWKNIFAIWEVFINETPDGNLSPILEPYGSSCVWNDKAFSFANRERLYPNKWTTPKLKDLLSESGISLYSIIYDIISCKQGKLFEINPSDDTVIVINPNDNENRMEIPLPEGIETEQRISVFLEKNNLESYTYINLTR
jgi:hypothetical protein